MKKLLLLTGLLFCLTGTAWTGDAWSGEIVGGHWVCASGHENDTERLNFDISPPGHQSITQEEIATMRIALILKLKSLGADIPKADNEKLERSSLLIARMPCWRMARLHEDGVDTYFWREMPMHFLRDNERQ